MINIVDLIEKIIAGFEAEKQIKNMWRPPLAALLPANHPRIPLLKETAVSNHLMPEEILPGAKSIIIFFIPFDEKIINSNLKGEAASEEWALSYVLTNTLLGRVSDELEKVLNRHGFRAGKIKPTHNFDEKTLMSRWSHRHLAEIAGLGSFGINNMLITQEGCCGRLGSLVTDAGVTEFEIDITEAKPADEKCLYKKNGSCGICQKNCINGAYTDGIFDRHKCYEMCLKNAEIHKAAGYADVCGKCLVGLPCSSRDPSSL
jgi:epoxyqueuosine reductase QueG